MTNQASAPPPNDVSLKLQQLRAAVERLNRFPNRQPLGNRERFSRDPRDEVKLHWANELPTWWHFDVEARMVHRETLWITEKIEELFTKYFKPVWWDRFVERANDLFGSIHGELIQPVWSVFLAPLFDWLPSINWPWNFELRGAHVSVTQSAFRRIVFDNRISDELLERLRVDPDSFLEAGQSLKRDDRTTVARVPLKAPGGNGTSGWFPSSAIGVLKRFNLRGLGHTLTHLLWFTRASRCWVYGREMLDAGVATSRPLAMIEERLGPFRFRSFVLTEFVEGTHFDQFLQQTRLSLPELDRLAGQFAQIWHTLGDLRLIHGDLKAANFLVTPDRQLKVIDLDGTWRHWFDVTYLPRRDHDWLRFMKNWRGQPEVGAAFRAAVARHFDEMSCLRQSQQPPAQIRLQRAA
jgi:lipopolysaccharide kinase (Kdo/WaaP) family protein